MEAYVALERFNAMDFAQNNAPFTETSERSTFQYILKFHFNSYLSTKNTSLKLLKVLEFDTETQKRAARTQTR